MLGGALDAERAAKLPGFYGKLPAYRDFIRRRLSTAFVQSWDGWLQEAVSESRRQLSESWLDAYLISPIWRFALSRGLCGPEAVVGIMMPSVDAVNRHYPMVITACLPDATNLFHLAAHAQNWFAGVENAAVSWLVPKLDLDTMDASLQQCCPLEALTLSFSELPCAFVSSTEQPLRWSVAQDEEFNAENFYPAIIEHLVRERLGAFSLWWTRGSDQVPPSFVLYSGLPPATEFALLLCDRGRLGEASTELFPLTSNDGDDQ